MTYLLSTVALILETIHTVRCNYYCEFGLCDEQDQYCCGLNKCCNKNLNLWLFWSFVLFVIFVAVIVAVCKRCHQKLGYEKVEVCADMT